MKYGVHVQDMLRKTIDAVPFADTYTYTVEHENCESGLLELMSESYIVLTGHVVPMGHYDKGFRSFFRLQYDTFYQRAFIRWAAEGFMMELRVFPEIPVCKPGGFRHAKKEILSVFRIGS